MRVLIVGGALWKRLEVARTLLHVKRFDEAFKVLRSLWTSMSWRKEGWWSLVSEVLWSLHECALRVGDKESYIATEWELYGQGRSFLMALFEDKR